MNYLPQINSKAVSKDAFLLFLIGCFSVTQIRLGAKIGISEIFMVLAMPMLFLKNLPYYRADGMLPLLNLLFLWAVGAIFSDFYNRSTVFQYLRGISVPVTVLAAVVCIHNFLRRDIRNYKWLILGMACSHVIAVFIFQRGSAGDLAIEGDTAGAIDAVVGYKLFWANMIKRWVLLPVQMYYLQTPIVFSCLGITVASIASAMSGGRSAFLVSIISLVLIFYSRRNVKLMLSIRRHILVFLCIIGLVGICVKSAYKYAATHGLLADSDTLKFERQTAQGDSALQLLMSGRAHFFIGLFAAKDRPIVGYGSWPLDKEGYTFDFLSKYGNEDDFKMLKKIREQNKVSIIPSHSHIICYWLWHGIFGLLFWCYVIYISLRSFTKLHVMPELFGYFAAILPSFLWDIFFSPFGLRVEESTLFVLMILVNKIAKNNNGIYKG